jgi:phosphoglycolate phosphatase-like HAD superfamily hydrolase
MLKSPIYLDLDGTVIKSLFKDEEKQEFLKLAKKDIMFSYTEKVLKRLKKKHALILITKRSNRYLLIKELRYLGLIKYFDKIIHTSQKPKELFMNLDNAVIVGDTEVDIKAGKEKGLLTIAVYSGCRTKEQLNILNPDWLIPDIRGIEKCL